MVGPPLPHAQGKESTPFTPDPSTRGRASGSLPSSRVPSDRQWPLVPGRDGTGQDVRETLRAQRGPRPVRTVRSRRRSRLLVSEVARRGPDGGPHPRLEGPREPPGEGVDTKEGRPTPVPGSCRGSPSDEAVESRAVPGVCVPDVPPTRVSTTRSVSTSPSLRSGTPTPAGDKYRSDRGEGQ